MHYFVPHNRQLLCATPICWSMGIFICKSKRNLVSNTFSWAGWAAAGGGRLAVMRSFVVSFRWNFWTPPECVDPGTVITNFSPYLSLIQLLFSPCMRKKMLLNECVCHSTDVLWFPSCLNDFPLTVHIHHNFDHGHLADRSPEKELFNCVAGHTFQLIQHEH